MKKTFLWLCLTVFAILMNACKNDDSNADPIPATSSPIPSLAPLTGDKRDYQLIGGITGTVTFSKRSDNSTLVTISLSGTTGNHPVHIHNSEDKIIVDLGIVTSPGSSHEIPKSRITYDKLIELKGTIVFHVSTTDFDYIATANL